jgi:hypothetical protein
LKFSALSIYLGKDIIRLLEKAIEMEGLSMAAYQKKLVYKANRGTAHLFSWPPGARTRAGYLRKHSFICYAWKPR